MMCFLTTDYTDFTDYMSSCLKILFYIPQILERHATLVSKDGNAMAPNWKDNPQIGMLCPPNWKDSPQIGMRWPQTGRIALETREASRKESEKYVIKFMIAIGFESVKSVQSVVL